MPLNIGARIEGDFLGSNDLGRITYTPNPRTITNYPQGVAVGQADVVFADTRTLAASASENLDLNGTALQSVTGANLALVKVKAIYLRAADGNTNSVVFGNAATNAFNGPLSAAATITVPPGGEILLTAPPNGWPVVAATGDLLKIANSGAGSSVDYDIFILGTSA